APLVHVTRTADGLVLPAAEKASSPPPQPTAPAVGATSVTAPPLLEMTVSSFQLQKGRIEINDRAVQPAFNGALSDLGVEAHDLRWPDLALNRFRLGTRTPGSGEIEISGTGLAKGSGNVQLDVHKVDLPWLNPYATSYSAYRVGSGAASVSSKAVINGT